jgi:hypothetical protein
MLWIGDLDQARNDADAALREEPSEIAYEVRGDIRWARDELDLAAKDYAFALRLDPNDDLAAKLHAVQALRDVGRGGAPTAPQPTSRSSGQAPAAEAPAAVLVRRVRQKQGGGGRYRLWIDGGECGSLAGGEEAEVRVSPGRHAAQVGWGPIKSELVDVDVRPGETLMLECGEIPGSFGMGKFVVREPRSGGKPFKD